jgi:hypothetical protein
MHRAGRQMHWSRTNGAALLQVILVNKSIPPFLMPLLTPLSGFS